MQNYYAILGVQQDAGYEEVRRAYHDLAKKFHPDVYAGSDGDLRFKLINEAYRTLRNPQRRKQYDFKLRYGTIIDFTRTARSEVDQRRAEMRKEYIRRKQEEARSGYEESVKTQRILNNVMFWSMAGILGIGFIFSLVDALLNLHYGMLIFTLIGIGGCVIAYFQFLHKK